MMHELHGKHDHACDARRQAWDFYGGQQQVNLLDDGDHGASGHGNWEPRLRQPLDEAGFRPHAKSRLSILHTHHTI